MNPDSNAIPTAEELSAVIDRQATESAKWQRYDPDVLPLWVADMDFRSPQAVIDAICQRAEHGVFGYPQELPDLRPVVVERLARLWGWHVEPEALLFLPGVVTAFNQAIHATTAPGDGVLAQTPVYYPILYAPPHAGCLLDQMELSRRPDGRYEVDLDRFRAAITPRTRIFVLCNPHNPVGRVFQRDELEAMAEICLQHDMIICSDEIHNELIFRGHHHRPIASLDPEVAQRTITLMAPSKTFHIAGLHFSGAIIDNADLRTRFVAAGQGLVSWVNLMGQVAALAAYRDGDPWLAAVLDYLEANLDFLLQYVEAHLPGVSMARPEGTFLAWLDCRGADLPGSPHEFFLEKARVALNEGATFGCGGEGFARLNFACPRATLEQALERMRAALEARA
ncbi:MAG: pyridoxal phosphate-dependent aminotransferase [Anaerolineae bacterium]